MLNVSNGVTANDFGLQEENINISNPQPRERPLVKITGWGSTERVRKTDGQKKIEEGERMQYFMKNEDESLIDVENVETTSSATVLSSPLWPPFLLQFCLLRLSRASLAFCATYFTFLSVVFIVLTRWRYPSQHHYDSCAHCVVAV